MNRSVALGAGSLANVGRTGSGMSGYRCQDE
jgi:hypothetical protein